MKYVPDAKMMAEPVFISGVSQAEIARDARTIERMTVQARRLLDRERDMSVRLMSRRIKVPARAELDELGFILDMLEEAMAVTDAQIDALDSI